MPTVFTVLRAVTLFYSQEDSNLGLYGAFGYDLAFQFDAIELKLKRPDDQRDMVLFLPDEILVVDHYAAKAWIDRYDFAKDGKTTEGKPAISRRSRSKPSTAFRRTATIVRANMPKLVIKAKESFRRGDLFEVVPGQKFFERCESSPFGDLQSAEGDQPVALFLLHQSRKPGVSGWRLAGNVRARLRPPHRDLPDFRHDQARRRSDRGLGTDPEALELQEGRVRAHHVLGRRPQRQVQSLRARLGARSSAAARSRCIRA